MPGRTPSPSRLLHNWRAKLGSLLVAAALWYLLERAIEPTPAPAVVPARTLPRFP